MTNSSYHIVACKVIQRRLGKTPAKSFVQRLNLQKNIPNAIQRNYLFQKYYYQKPSKQTNKRKKKKLQKTKKKNKTKKLTIGILANISFSRNSTIITNKHALFVITGPLVHQSRVVFTTWLPFSPFENSQRSSTHPGPIPGLFR